VTYVTVEGEVRVPGAERPNDAPTLAELSAFLTDIGISRRKLPEQLEVVDTLPMTASGKVDKQALRDR